MDAIGAEIKESSTAAAGPQTEISRSEPRGAFPAGGGAACIGGGVVVGAADCGGRPNGRSTGAGCTGLRPTFRTEAENAEREAGDNMGRLSRAKVEDR
jgi:hypothetical protein